ncbi:MAG: lytic transglycosylase domain-containing protein [Clostridia bacterium]|nr:lytic transglycosylase domain-containing protein [Clostridia bacterium]
MKRRKKKNRMVWWLLGIIVILVIGILLIHRLFPYRYEEEIKSFAQEYTLPYWTVVAIIKTESNFEPDAQSPKNAQGLMQLKENTASWFADKENIPQGELTDPSYNIKIGCAYLAYLRQSFGGDIYVALAAYNAGEGNVRTWLENPVYSSDGKTLENIPFPETENYIKKIKMYQKIYRWIYG